MILRSFFLYLLCIPVVAATVSVNQQLNAIEQTLMRLFNPPYRTVWHLPSPEQGLLDQLHATVEQQNPDRYHQLVAALRTKLYAETLSIDGIISHFLANYDLPDSSFHHKLLLVAFLQEVIKDNGTVEMAAAQILNRYRTLARRCFNLLEDKKERLRSSNISKKWIALALLLLTGWITYQYYIKPTAKLASMRPKKKVSLAGLEERIASLQHNVATLATQQGESIKEICALMMEHTTPTPEPTMPHGGKIVKLHQPSLTGPTPASTGRAAPNRIPTTPYPLRRVYGDQKSDRFRFGVRNDVRREL